MRSLRWRLLIVTSLLLAALAGAQPATAVPANCPAGAACIYRDINYSPTPYKFYGANASWGPWPGIENDDSSWCNNGTTGRLARIWTGRNYTGAWFVLPKGSCVPRDPEYDNRGSSNDWPWHT
jgi:hypothetical protein